MIAASQNGAPRLQDAEAAYAPIIISSPCARLMMFIMPRMMISPSAHSNKNAALVQN